MRRLRGQIARIRQRDTWRAAWRRSGTAALPWELDFLPFVIGFYAAVAALLGVLIAIDDWGSDGLGWSLLATGGALILGLIWLLWEPPWMRGTWAGMDDIERQGTYFLHHATAEAVFVVLSRGLLLSISLVVAAASWSATSTPVRPIGIGGGVGLVVGGAWFHAAVIRRWRIPHIEAAVLRRLIWFPLVATLVLLSDSGTPEALAGAAAVVVVLVGDILSSLVRIRRRVRDLARDPIQADADLAHQASALGTGWRPSTMERATDPGLHGGAKAGEHWPPHPRREPER